MTIQTITLPARTITVQIASFNHQKGQSVLVILSKGSVGEAGNFIPAPMTGFDPAMTQVIDGDNYTDLMSDRPSWAPNKPAGTFREDDLWQFIGK